MQKTKTLILVATAMLSGCANGSWQAKTVTPATESKYEAPKALALFIHTSAKDEKIADATKVLEKTVVDGLAGKGVTATGASTATAAPAAPYVDLEILGWNNGSGVLRALTVPTGLAASGAGAGEAEILVRMKLVTERGTLLDGTVKGSSTSLTTNAAKSAGVSAMAAPEDAGRAIVNAVVTGKL